MSIQKISHPDCLIAKGIVEAEQADVFVEKMPPNNAIQPIYRCGEVRFVEASSVSKILLELYVIRIEKVCCYATKWRINPRYDDKCASEYPPQARNISHRDTFVAACSLTSLLETHF